MSGKEYTQQEVDSKINVLKYRQAQIKEERKTLNSNLRSIKEQIEYWKKLDKSQLKAF